MLQIEKKKQPWSLGYGAELIWCQQSIFWHRSPTGALLAFLVFFSPFASYRDFLLDRKYFHSLKGKSDKVWHNQSISWHLFPFGIFAESSYISHCLRVFRDFHISKNLTRNTEYFWSLCSNVFQSLVTSVYILMQLDYCNSAESVEFDGLDPSATVDSKSYRSDDVTEHAWDALTCLYRYSGLPSASYQRVLFL